MWRARPRGARIDLYRPWSPNRAADSSAVRSEFGVELDGPSASTRARGPGQAAGARGSSSGGPNSSFLAARGGTCCNFGLVFLPLVQESLEQSGIDATQAGHSKHRLARRHAEPRASSTRPSTATARDSRDTMRRTTLALKRCGQLRNVFSSPDVPLSLKVSIYKSAVMSLMTYGCEAWSLTPRLQARINGANSRCLARLTGRSVHSEVSPHT